LDETTTAFAELLTRPKNKENNRTKLIVAKAGNLLDLPLESPDIAICTLLKDGFSKAG
jgi:hypothetical protein